MSWWRKWTGQLSLRVRGAGDIMMIGRGDERENMRGGMIAMGVGMKMYERERMKGRG